LESHKFFSLGFILVNMAALFEKAGLFFPYSDNALHKYFSLKYNPSRGCQEFAPDCRGLTPHGY